jgi:peroxiredoxin
MAALQPPVCEFSKPAVDFNLLGVDGRYWTLQDCMGDNGLLVMFICNHCPFVKAIQDRLLRDTRELLNFGVKSVAIMSNDTVNYPADSFENMQKIAEQQAYSFPYLLDDTQSVAQAYGAVCTPDFFGYNANAELQYRGRLDASGMQAAPADSRRELFEAMTLIAQTGNGPQAQIASMGCSIKWK